jgi:hypothetical protein
MPNEKQPVTDDSIKVRQLTHYQFCRVAGEPGKPGTYTLQLVLDQGAWEEVLTLDPDDADNLQDLLTNTERSTTTSSVARCCSGSPRPGANRFRAWRCRSDKSRRHHTHHTRRCTDA